MTHKDIYTKFMIEYDKANVTSSYPSLTEYEIATVLDKAYNALIAQKVTGNNVRRMPLEGDLKAVTDISPLIKTEDKELTLSESLNIGSCELPNDLLYFISGKLTYDFEDVTPMDQKQSRPLLLKLVNHETADKFIISAHNLPWIKNPVCYIEDNVLYVVYDSINTPEGDKGASLTYIKVPNKFAKDLNTPETGWVSFFDWGAGDVPEEYIFECNDTMAEELISLAVSFALENVESQRLNSKLNMRGLEA